MQIVFPPVDDSYIRAKIEDGFYSNAAELVRDAVRRLRENDDARYARLIAALEIGDQAAKEGRVNAYTPELLERIAKGAVKAAAEGRKPNPDAWP